MLYFHLKDRRGVMIKMKVIITVRSECVIHFKVIWNMNVISQIMVTISHNFIGQFVVLSFGLNLTGFAFFLGYPNVKHFSWDKYLEETNSLPAPARAFKVVS